MKYQEIDQILSEWSEELKESLGKSKTLCIALFGVDKKLLFANPTMYALFKGEPYKSFINPTFDKLLALKSDGPLIFEGLLTIGNYTSINSSILANVFLKDGKLLIVGGADTVQLINHYNSVLQLNQKISNLQRQLLKEKSTLENTLNQLNKTNSILEQTNTIKDKFFSIIAHDLKSPFSSIIGLSEIMVEQIQENNLDGIEKYAERVLQSSNSGMALLMNLIEWAQSQTGRMEFKPEHFEMSSFITEQILLFEDIARQKSVSINKEISPNLTVFADKNMISTIVRNLISNAIKFAREGNDVLILAKKNPKEILVSVKDNGIGISSSRLEKLFHIDESISTLGTNKEKGSGLGLILCKDFVEKHGGKIWAESEVGKGSVFYFTIPCDSECEVMEIIESNLPEEKTNKQAPDKKLKILIAEDEIISEMLIKTMVSKHSKEILIARNGLEAVDICRKNTDIDIVLMDIQMPEMDGYEAARQIRQFDNNVIIIAQTAHGLKGEREKLIEAGCNDYISKPINRDKIQALIKKYFGK
ncbi:MAG: hybrid sensor histidine kinase/response regulator [Bacteroidota bacterium]